MTKIELMQQLAEIPGDFPIMFQVPTDEILDDFGWMCMREIKVEGVKDVYRHEENVFTDIADLRDHLEFDVEEAEIERAIEETPHEKMIVIKVQS